MEIAVNLKNNAYKIIIGKNTLLNVGEFFNVNRKVLIVTDSGVPKKHINTLQNQCLNSFIFTFPCGEINKNLDTFSKICTTLLENGFTRKDAVIALGGGVVGDVAAFAAASYMRGIDFCNVPTTLLSQLDSSVGGKSGVNLNGVKNVVGAFKQPNKVIIDVDTLDTLDKRQLSNGLAEALKMAVLFDENLFSMIEKIELNSNKDEFQEIIARAVRLKAEIVEKDETEQDLRRVLNFGHTIGHAIESLKMGELLHGECVGLGMIPMLTNENDEKRILSALNKFSLPTRCGVKLNEITKFIMHDKKAENGMINLIFSDKIGTFRQIKTTYDDFNEYLMKKCGGTL